MNSLTDLREVVDVVIGVDIHVHTHSAAVVDAATGGVLDEITVEATAEGHFELMEFANNHAMLRAWTIEGTDGHGAGLSRHLLESSEIVIELDRPKRAARRNGAKSVPLDAIRAAREAMARPRLGTPRTGGERQALSVLLAARRSAINASTEAQPLRRPPAQQRTAHRRTEPNPVPASNPRLRRSPYCRRQDRPRDQTLPGPLRRPRPLPTTRKQDHRCLTKHRSDAALAPCEVVVIRPQSGSTMQVSSRSWPE
jgi:hypothetical protein